MKDAQKKAEQERVALDAGEERALALAWHLDIDPDDVTEMAWGDGENFDAGGLGEYRVLTDGEADEAVEEYIRETLWAFNPEFLVPYIADGSLRPEDVAGIIGGRCEDANPALLALVGNSLPELIEGAVQTDGRGIFLAGYDFEEIESEEIDMETFYIYRTN